MSKLIQVPYFQQNDNEIWGTATGNVQCCPTSNAMLAAWGDPDMIANSKKNGFEEPESYYKSKLEAFGYSANDRGDHNAHTVTLQKAFGIMSEWRTDLTSKQIVQSIDSGTPVVVGFVYKYSGHICLITGYYDDEGGGLLVNDPYGVRAGAADDYSYINPGFGDQSGQNDRYSWGILNRILFEGNNQGAWGRWVTHVNGKATGL